MKKEDKKNFDEFWSSIGNIVHYLIEHPEIFEGISNHFKNISKNIEEFFKKKCPNCGHMFLISNFNWNTLKWSCPNCSKEL